jgi:hypothetical protein
MSDEMVLSSTDGDPLIGKERHAFVCEKPGERRLSVSGMSGEKERPVRNHGSAGMEQDHAPRRERGSDKELIERVRQFPIRRAL